MAGRCMMIDMKTKLKRNLIIAAVAGVALVLLVVGIDQVIILRKAHSTFDNYYAFRGCAQLLEKTDTYGICKTTSGSTIKIVEIGNRWYLEGDGPGIW
jgi:purine-cytosine permease-like protein